MQKGIVSKNTDWDFLLDGPKKTVFLNDDNLSTLKGYKAIVCKKGGLIRKVEVVVTITGLSDDAAARLIGSLKPMDIYSERGESIRG